MSPIQTAAKIEECRDAMCSLLGNDYSEKVKPYKEAIQQRMTGSKTELTAAIQLAVEFKNEGNDGFPVAMAMAACADLIEGKTK